MDASGSIVYPNSTTLKKKQKLIFDQVLVSRMVILEINSNCLLFFLGLICAIICSCQNLRLSSDSLKQEVFDIQEKWREEISDFGWAISFYSSYFIL